MARARISFARASLLMVIAFDPLHRVSGLHFLPADPSADWLPPSYAAPETFEEESVMVGASPALPGTLTLPKHAQRVPAIVLVHGSGPNDRDETIGVLKPFKDLAWGLGRRGIAVLRYDKRTRVAPAGVRTEKEEVDDGAHAAVALLLARPEVDPTRIALLGHSQGGALAPRIARADPAIRLILQGERDYQVTVARRFRDLESGARA